MSGRWRVIKLGGSLLDWPPLVAEFRRWLAAQPPARNVLIVGGGAIVEQLRALDRLHNLTPEAAHWLAIRAMGVTAELMAHMLPEAQLVRSWPELHDSAADQLMIFDVERFLRSEQDQADALPAGWDVTSDSIAARIAVRLEGVELVLLKSTVLGDAVSAAGEATPAALVAAGLVDGHFARVVGNLPVRVINLRATSE